MNARRKRRRDLEKWKMGQSRNRPNLVPNFHEISVTFGRSLAPQLHELSRLFSDARESIAMAVAAHFAAAEIRRN